MNTSARSLFMTVGGSKYILIPLLAAALLAGCGGGNPPPASSGPAASANVALSTVVSGLSAPLDLQQPNDGSGRLFIVQQGGTTERPDCDRFPTWDRFERRCWWH
jgi:hypothetical protein